jgi:5-methylcytosine-specific restriction endonuclease McrA
MNRKRFNNKALEDLARHRKKNLPGPVKDRRYIKGTIHARIQEAVNPRNSGDVTTDKEVRAAVLQKSQGRCFYCHRKYTQEPLLAKNLPKLYFNQLEIDHIVPHSKRGPNWKVNYVAACRRCNQLKSNLSIAEFKILLIGDQRRRGY